MREPNDESLSLWISGTSNAQREYMPYGWQLCTTPFPQARSPWPTGMGDQAATILSIHERHGHWIWQVPEKLNSWVLCLWVLWAGVWVSAGCGETLRQALCSEGWRYGCLMMSAKSDSICGCLQVNHLHLLLYIGIHYPPLSQHPSPCHLSGRASSTSWASVHACIT